MVQVISDEFGGNVLGRLGKGFGKALSEQAPKEIERARLASGLHKLEQEKNLDPMQFLTRAIGIPGITPQAIESLGKLAQQRMKGQALSNIAENVKQPPSFPEFVSDQGNKSEEELAPSLTTRGPIEATLHPYIPKTYNQILQRGAELYNQSPALYENDPQKAINAAQQEDQQEQSINARQQQQRINEQQVQNVVTESLKNQHTLLKNNVPARAYSNIENKAINAVKSIQEGGEGLTEQQAIKKYGDQLDAISRDYSSLRKLGSYTLPFSKDPGGAIKSLQSKFAERGQLEDFADGLTSENGLSPMYAYSLAYPINEDKGLSSIINKAEKIPLLPPPDIPKPLYEREITQKTLNLSSSLAKQMGKDASPLAIAEALKNKGYDPVIWLNYLRDHRKELNLSERQGRELDKSESRLPRLNDLWLKTWADIK